MLPPEPQRPDGGRAMLILLVLALVLAALAIWGFLQTRPGTPTPAGTASPKVLPSGGGAAHP